MLIVDQYVDDSKTGNQNKKSNRQSICEMFEIQNYGLQFLIENDHKCFSNVSYISRYYYDIASSAGWSVSVCFVFLPPIFFLS